MAQFETMTQKQKILIATAIAWAEIHYNDQNLDETSCLLVNAVNNALEEPETMTLDDLSYLSVGEI